MLNGIGHDYFSLLLHRDKRGPVALEKLVDDIHCDKERTINSFLCHSGSEDFLWGLVHLLGNKNSRVAGNAAYVLGTLAESDLGCYRVISLTNSKHPDSDRIMRDLSDMLLCEDAESVMNAAGTMGTLAESPEGRTWMLREACLPQTISHITKLLNNENLWTASNAALVLARLTIAEEGCEIVLNHPDVELILTNLIMSLGVDEAGRGMNAAFAIGRVSDIDTGRSKLLSLPDSEKMITSLSKMLGSTDQGASKNSCFALSCLATTSQGHHRLLKNIYSESVIQTLSELLSSEDGETGWFSAMTLRTLASHCEGCVRLREHSEVLPALQSVEKRTEVNSDLKEEVQQTLEILKKLDKPAAPTVEVDGCHKIDVSWEAMTTKSGLSIQYQLYQGSQLVYTGTKLSYTATDLAPHTQYAYRVRAFTQGDDSPMSDITSTVTQETVPGPPENFHVVATTTTQCKVTWDAPNEMNGVIKGYHVYNGKSLVEHTNELTSIISGLAPNTSYNIYVCASTVQGKGEQAEVCVTTAETGAHAPSKPEIIVRGRHELQVAWKPPVVPLGRISRYDLTSNGEVVYSGTDLHYTVHRLKPDTEYSFVVYAITSEGKCESKTTKKRTAKDGYDGDRAPLYQTPVRRDSVDTQADSKPTPAQMRQKRKSICGSLGMQPEVKSSSPKRASSAKARTVVITSKEPEKEPDKEPETEPEKEQTPEPPAQEVAIPKQDVPPTDTTPPVEVPMPVVEPVSHPSVDETDRTSITPPLKSMKSPVPESDTPTVTKQKSILKPTTCSVPERSNTALSNKTATTFGNSEQSSVDQPLPKPMRPDFTKFKPMKPSIVSNPSKVTKRAMRRPSIQSVGSDGVNEGQKTWKMKDSLVGGSTKQENEGKFMENNIMKSDDSTDLTKSFSNLHSGFFKLSASTTGSNQSRHLNSFIMDYDPLSSLTKAPANPARSNAMVHPPSTTKIGMRQNRRYAVERPVVSKTITANPSNLTKQLQPDFVKAEADRKHNTSKFIPMQYRTQPLNMPGQVSRQHTSFTFTQNKNPPMRSLESLTRSRTELTLGDPHKEYVSSNINTYMSGNASAVYEYQQKLMQQEDRLTSLQESHAEQIPDLKRQSTVLSMSHQKHNEPFMNRLTIGSTDKVH